MENKDNKKEKEKKRISPYEFFMNNISKEIEIVMKDGTSEKGTLNGFDQCQNLYINSGKKELFIKGDSIKLIKN